MTCPPFCAKCGGNLGHPANGNELCKKCNPSSTPPPVTEALWLLVHAQSRLLDKWADGDEAVKQQLWQALHRAGDTARDALEATGPCLFQPTEEELAAIRQIGLDQELSDQQVMRQALRFYQIKHVRVKAGETLSFSGDAQRAADFAGPLAARSNQEATALEGYRAAVSYISADSWDGCSDCMEILRSARSADFEWDWAGSPDKIAGALKSLRKRAPVQEATRTVGDAEIERIQEAAMDATEMYVSTKMVRAIIDALSHTSSSGENS